jgi:hypothetical protein
MRRLHQGRALLGAFVVGVACNYDFDQYLAPSEVNAGGHAGATPPVGGSGTGGAQLASGGLNAGGGAAGDGGSAANSVGGEAESAGGTTSGGAPPSEGGAPIDSGGAGGESAGGESGASPAASGGGSLGGSGGSGGSGGDSGATGTGGSGGDGGFDCAKAAGTVFNGHCYFLVGAGFGAGLEWDEAKTACSSLAASSHLLTITSEAEEQFVEATFFPAAEDLWIGLALASTADPPNSCRRMPATCPFEWVTNEPLAYSKWGSSGSLEVEPNYSGACVRIRFDAITWADLDCDEELPAICETS